MPTATFTGQTGTPLSRLAAFVLARVPGSAAPPRVGSVLLAVSHAATATLGVSSTATARPSHRPAASASIAVRVR